MTGLSEADCAIMAGVDPTTLSKWKSRGLREGSGPYFNFFNDLRLALPHFKRENLQVIKDARRSDWRAAKALLEMTAPEEFRRQHHKHAGDVTDPTPIPHQDVPISPEDLRARAQRAQAILQESGTDLSAAPADGDGDADA